MQQIPTTSTENAKTAKKIPGKRKPGKDTPHEATRRWVYVEVLGEFHKKVNPEESQAKIRSIQQTKLGGILFEIGGENFGLLRCSKESH